MEECNLTKELNTVLQENIKLKQENQQLRETLKMQKNWNSIREGYLLPIFRNKYGNDGDTLYSNVLISIREIVKNYLGVSKIYEINENNYELAKEMGLALTNAFCEHEWKHIENIKEVWNKYDKY